jgi:hypothetical protein
MLELLIASTIVGSTEIAPNVLQIDYLTSDQTIVTILDYVEMKGDFFVDHD